MEEDSNHEVKPNVKRVFLDVKLDINELECREEPSRSISQDDQHYNDFSSDHTQGSRLPLFPISQTEIAPSAPQDNLEKGVSGHDLKPDERADDRVSDIKGESVSQEHQHGDCLLANQKHDTLKLFSVSKNGISPDDVMKDLNHEESGDNFNATVEEEKPCILALRASVEAYLANAETDKRDTELGSLDKIGTLQKSADSFLHFESKSTILALEKQNDIEHDKQSGGPEPPIGYKKANLMMPSEDDQIHGCSPKSPTDFKLGEERPYKSSVCDVSFSSTNKLKRHTCQNSKKSRCNCDDCKKRLKKGSVLTIHKRVDSRERSFRCDMCRKSFTTLTKLKYHLRAHSDERPYKCNECDKSFLRKNGLARHKSVHLEEKRQLICDMCQKSYTTFLGLRNHLKEHSIGKQNRCNLCDKSFTRPKHLTSHKRVHSSEKPYKCNDCDKSFSSSDTLKRHGCRYSVKSSELTIHNRVDSIERPFRCDICGKSYATLNFFKWHLRDHSNEKPYKCNECDKSYVRKDQLAAHKSVHSEERRQFICDMCQRNYVTFNGLRDHLKKHTGGRQYRCSVCDKSFLTNSYLEDHKRIHSGERPYKCNECDKAFADRRSFHTHKRVHSEERPYKCSECDKGFKRKSNLIAHKRVHSGKRPYKCDECGKGFVVKNKMLLHRRVHAGERPYSKKSAMTVVKISLTVVL